MTPSPVVSVLIPCYNESASIADTVERLNRELSGGPTFELIAIEDGSTDDTLAGLRALEAQWPTLRVIPHDRNRGYGAALKTGMRHARAELVAIIDADGTYPIDRLGHLVALAENYDMVVGARTGANVTYPLIRKIPKYFLRRWVSWIVKYSVPDINSGMRVFRKSMAQKFVRILPDGFSFTITITISSMRNNYRVHYEPIDYFARTGQSKIRPIHDTLRFLQIIGRTGMYFAPLRILGPIALGVAALSIGSLLYDVFALDNLTDKTVILFASTLNLGVFALLADMIDKRSTGA